MKKLLVLGAMQMHIPLLKRAKECGLYVLTCDYIPENEGHKYADEPHYESTTDFAAVLELARKSNIDAILTFNSDPAALTAAYVAERLQLCGSGYEAVKIMSEKDLFRKFLASKGFNVPYFETYTNWADLNNDLGNFRLPILLKPVDSSGSKGVVTVNDYIGLEREFDNSMQYSRCKRIIVEEFIEPLGPQLHGDGFVLNGNIQFSYLGDHHFNSSINNLVPYSTTFPSVHSQQDIMKVENEVQRFISLVGFKQGGINIEARISAKDNKVYLIEVGPRNGGNFTPIVIQYASGFNFIDAALYSVLGKSINKQVINKKGYYSYLILHSDKTGILKSIYINAELEAKILEKYIYVPIGGIVHSFRGANAAIGVLLTKFESLEEMNYIVSNFTNYYDVTLEP